MPGFIHDGQANDKEEREGNEKPQQIVAREIFDFPGFLRGCAAEGIESREGEVDDGPSNTMQEFEDEDDDPTGRENWDHRGHPGEEGLESHSNARVSGIAGLSERLV